jgi:hypothetical protein
MYSGQFEIRRFPLAGLPSSDGGADELLELVVLLEPHAASARAAAAAALPPRNRLRVVLELANCDMSAGLI